MKEKIVKAVNDSIQAVSMLATPSSLLFIERSALMIAECFRQGHKLIIAGNGGSLCDANHFAEELVGLFRKPRAALPAISLSESGYLTAVGNDLGYEYVFSRGVEAYAQKGDIFVGMTTSGNSPNIIQAFQAAKSKQILSISFLGKGGGKLKGVADCELLIEGFTTSDRIQEAHMAAIHVIIEIVEEHLFYSETRPTHSLVEEVLAGVHGR